MQWLLSVLYKGARDRAEQLCEMRLVVSFFAVLSSSLCLCCKQQGGTVCVYAIYIDSPWAVRGCCCFPTDGLTKPRVPPSSDLFGCSAQGYAMAGNSTNNNNAVGDICTACAVSARCSLGCSEHCTQCRASFAIKEQQDSRCGCAAL